MPTTETEINIALAEVLVGMRRRWLAQGESLRGFAGNARRPDVLVTEPGVAPVIIETEVMPAITVEQDARSRLGESIAQDGKRVAAVVALRVPARFREFSQNELRNQFSIATDLEYALLTGESPTDVERFPHSGWLTGRTSDLADLVHLAAVPPRVVDAAVTSLEQGVTAVTGLLDQAISQSPDLADVVAGVLRQKDSNQTRRMAMTIVTNAFVFHENLAHSHGISSVDELRDSQGLLFKTVVLDEWRKIRQVNYYPIFFIAQEIVTALPQAFAAQICDRAARTAAQLVGAGLTRSHDLTGTVFQKLIADRKFLATFYTRPASAALLAALSVPSEAPRAGGTWADPEQVKRFLVADFACGTGTLLSAAYQRIARLHESAGGDGEPIHASMMEQSLVGCDVMPSAVHLTASMLAGVHPSIHFQGDQVYTFPYGKQADGQYALGSLDLLGVAGGTIPLFRTFAPVTAATGSGEDERPPALNLPPQSCDLVIMNPPFTRPTNHEGKRAKIPNPAFAAFGSDPEEQKAMSQLAKKLGSNTCANGNAGIASHFIALADRMVKQDGIVALVLPLAVLQGDSWQKARDIWLNEYHDITVITLAGARPQDKSFSADTGMGETLIVARKGQPNGGSLRGRFVTLRRRPESVLEGLEMARAVDTVRRTANLRRLEDGPFEGTSLSVGQEKVGEMLDCPLTEGEQWPVAGIADLSLAQVSHQLINGILWLPGQFDADITRIPMTTFRKIAGRGFLHRDINGSAGRGAFDAPVRPRSATASYPALWNHDANRERTMVVEPDSEARVRQGKETRANEIWNRASHAHHNADFQFNSQALGVAFTESLTIGGTAWPNIVFDESAHEIAFTLWGNSILGLLCYWWHATKQQSGRGRMSITALETLPTLDLRELDQAQLDAASLVFEDMKYQPMLPFNEADHDPVRQELDRRLTIDVLRLDSGILGAVDLLRRKLCAEPSIHGGKRSRTLA